MDIDIDNVDNIDNIDDLDSSWIDKDKKMGASDTNYIREPIDKIQLFFIYINDKSEIEYVSKDVESISSDSGCICKERLLQIIQTKRHHNNKKYRLDDLLSFQIDLEPENIQSFSEMDSLNDISISFFKSVPIFDEIICIPSIFIFHDIASLFFMFNEIDSSIKKSILRNNSDSHRVTKKVRIMDQHVVCDHENSSSNNRKSVKKFMKKLKKTRKTFDS
jgi:hypothetical protein